MKCLIHVFIFSIGFYVNAVAADHDPEIAIYTDQLVRMLRDNDADMVKTEQKEICLDINGYKPCYRFALFTLAGWNGGNGTWSTYLALFDKVQPTIDPKNSDSSDSANSKQDKKFRLLDIQKISNDSIGDQFSLENVEIQHSFIVLHGKGYNSHDPECCPTKSVTLKFTIDQEKIKLPAN